MSERRQLALLLAGLVVLVAVGIGGAALLGGECADLDQLGELDLAFVDAADAVPLEADAAAAVEALGDELGIGGWRGAVALPDDLDEVGRSEFGFFVVTDDAFVVLRPSMGIASAARGRSGLDVVPAGTGLVLRSQDGEAGVLNGEYELDRCGRLPAGELLALDRGFAVVVDGAEVVVTTLSGAEQWRGPATPAAHVTGRTVVLGGDGLLELRDLQDGEVLDRLEDVPLAAPVPWTDADGDRVLLRGPDGVLPVTVGAAAFDVDEPVPLPLASGPPSGAVRTPAGIVAHGTATDGDGTGVAALATDRSDTAVTLPAGVEVRDLLASADGHVGLVVEVAGRRALLVYGRDADV